jgi:NlpC/P60 family putative phage cell wall peptidase
MNEIEQRAAVIAEARRWLGTPYHHMGRIRGVGVDCVMLLAEVYAAVGVLPEIAIGYYPQDWHMHRSEELYLDGLKKYSMRIDSPQPGDVAMFKFGRTESHGAIVVAWPQVIHALMGRGVELASANESDLSGRVSSFWTPWRGGLSNG